MTTPAPLPYVRWLNLGSCIVRGLFNGNVLKQIDVAGTSMPVEITSVYRRHMASMRADWEAERPAAPAAADVQFLKYWSPALSVLASVDVVCADLPLDALYHGASPRMGHDSEPRLADYDQLVTNFPFEPGDGLRKRLGLYACDETAWLDAWRWFGETIVKPTIILMMEERDDLPQGYPPSTRDRLRRYQERLESLAKAFPHWHCVHIDELLAECGTDAYVDRHHLTAYGLDLLRQRLLTWIDHRGILQQSCTGRPLRYQSWVVPERCDFVPLSDVYPRALASLYRSPLLIGNSGVTSRLAPVLASRGAEPHAAETCAAAPDDRPVDAVVYLHWAQFSHGDPRLQQVRQRFPQTFVEVSSHWNEAVLVGTDEFALRQEMRTLGREHHAALHGHPDTGFRRYVARVLLSRQRNHDGGGDAEWRQLWTGPAGPSQAHSRVDDLYTRWQRLETSTVFCSGIALR